MLTRTRQVLIATIVLLSASYAAGQPTGIPAPKADPPPARDLVAAKVNGQVIPELAVYRGLMPVAPARRGEARKEVLNYLVENAIVDQYLLQLKIPVEPKEIADNIEKIKKEAAEEKKDLKTVLEELMITEDELRTELASALRWDKFVLQQGSDKVLQDYFKANPDMFNGSTVRARHILIPIDGKKEDAAAKLAAIKKRIDGEVAQAVARLPANADAITREKERARTLEKAFADEAIKNSTCPSAKDGGDLGKPFARVRDMVEPFASAAFALKPYQMSNPVETEFGYHLILSLEYRPGKDVKFEDKYIKSFVQEVYGARLRDAILARYKPTSKIEIVQKK